MSRAVLVWLHRSLSLINPSVIVLFILPFAVPFLLLHGERREYDLP